MTFTVDEALELLASLEDARDDLSESDHLAVIAQVEHQVAVLGRKLVSVAPEEDPMSSELLRASEAARRLQVPTKELLRLVHDRAIRYVMIDGIAHIPADAVEEYRAKAG